MSRWLSVASLSFVFIAMAAAGTHGSNATPKQVLTWSRAAAPLPFPASQDAALLNTRVPSPNGHHEIACSSAAIERHEEQDGAAGRLAECFLVADGKRSSEIGLSIGPEALWAPDSRAVAVTGSNGGALGIYRVNIYRPGHSGSADISTAVRNDLARRFPPCLGRLSGCTSRERRNLTRDFSWVNVAAIRWEKGSSRLLVLAWVPAAAYYGKNMGKYNGYVVDASTGNILKRYSKQEFERRFRKYCGDWGL